MHRPDEANFSDAEGIASLRWYLSAGVDEVVGDVPVNRFQPLVTAPDSGLGPTPGPAPIPIVAPEPVAATQRPAVVKIEPSGDPREAGDLATLAKLVEGFDGCAIKETATHTVFGDGTAAASVMFVGEAPGAEEDRQGRPFVGASGRLLDSMLATIGLDRPSVYISNILYWRPPGNRNPTPAEVSACLPFVERQIELVDPDILVLVGGSSAKTLLGRKEGIMRLRGQWMTYSTPRMSRPIPTIATFHPAFLLRSPGRKREAWRDLLAIRERLDDMQGGSNA